MVHAAEAQRNYHLSGDGAFTKRCHQWIEERTGCAKALLTHSCTSALDMAALLLDLKSGDEVILPSYTFVSTVCLLGLVVNVSVRLFAMPELI